MPFEPSVYTGTASRRFNENLLANTATEYMPTFRQVVVDAIPLLKAMGVAAFGAPKMLSKQGIGGATTSSGKGIKFHGVGTGPQFETNLLTSRPSGAHVGRMDNINPAYNEPNVTIAYAYNRLVWPIMVPEEAVKDNRGNARLQNWLETEFKLAQIGAAQDLDYIVCGSSSAPSGAPFGLNSLVSYTQSSTYNAGGVTPATGNYWANQVRSCTSVGGGGELDRPLAFLRKLESLVIDTRLKGADINSQLAIASRGAYQYYRRAVYADTLGVGNASLRSASYDAVNIDHTVYYGIPMIYDTNVQVPGGGTASREAVYVVDLSELGLHVKSDEFFAVEQWDAPRPKDRQRYYQLNIWLRYVPAVTNRRIQGVLAELPQNADAA